MDNPSNSNFPHLNGNQNVLNNRIKLAVLLLLSFLFFYIYSFDRGGRWNLGEQIFISASNIDSSQPLYSGTDEGKPMLNGSPYFPGVAFLSYPIYKVTKSMYFTEGLMLAVAVLCIFFFIDVSYSLYKAINEHTKLDRISFFTLELCAFFIFNNLLDYSLEFKPDILSLGLAILFLVRSNTVRPKIKDSIINSLLIFAALSLKQQAAVFIFGIFAGNLISYIRNRRTRHLWNCIVLASSTMIFVLLILQSESLLIHTVFANTGRALRFSFPEFVNEILANNKVYLFLVLFILLSHIKKIKQISSRLSGQNNLIIIYSISICLYALIQAKSAINLGGTQGNIQVVLILTIPLILYLYELKFKPNLNVHFGKIYYILILCLLISALKYGIRLPHTISLEREAIQKLEKYDKIILPSDLITKTPLSNITANYYAYIHFKLGSYKNDKEIDEQYRRSFANSNYLAFNRNQLIENPSMLNFITLGKFEKFQVVDSAYARGFGKFYIYKLR